MSALRCFARLAVFRYKVSRGSSSHFKCLPSQANRKFYSTESKINITDTDPKLSAIVDVLLNAGVDMKTITSALDSSPEILSISPGQLERCFNELIHNGFTGENCLNMVFLYPPLLKLREGEITSALETWRSSQLGDARVISLLKNCPHFICMDLSEIPRRLPLLKSISSQKNVVRLLKNAPNLMFENWDQVVAKMDYLENIMKVDKKHILNTYALNRSLSFLKTRHVFLERCGVYKTPKSKRDPTEVNRNPALSLIMDTNDDRFAENVAGLTTEEYEVFQELYQEELKEDESDSDID